MSLVWIDGFDSQDLTRWTPTGTPTFMAGRLGGYGVQLNGSSDGIIRTIPSLTTLSVGFAVNVTANAAGSPFTMSLRNAAAQGLVILTGSTSGWQVTHYLGSSSTTTVSLSSVVVDAWTHFEITYVNHPTAGTVLIKQDGNIVHNYTAGTSTNIPGTPVIDIAYYSLNVSEAVIIDDIWVSTGELYGDSRVRGLVPTADSTTAWTTSTGTSHYALVDEVPPAMTDYVSATAGSGLEDKFTLTVPGDLTAVTAVQVNAYGLKTDAGSAPLRMLADGQESADIGFSTSAGGLSAIFPTAASSAAWTPAKLAAAGAFGIKAV